MLEDTKESSLREQLVSKDREIVRLSGEIEYLRTKVKSLLMARSGKKQERFAPSENPQLSLLGFEDVPVCVESKKSTPSNIKVKEHLRAVEPKAERSVKSRLPENLREVEVIAEVPVRECSCCKQPMAVVGLQETSRTLSVIPEEYFWKIHKAPTYSCKKCPSQIERVLPVKAAERIQVDERFLSTLVVMKVLYALPIYRYSKLLKSRGINLKYDTLLSYFMKVAEIVTPLYEQLGKQVFSSRLMHGDESPFSVRTKEKNGKLSQTYMWPFLAIDIGVYYIWAASRDKKTLTSILTGFSGILCVDGLTLYESVAASLRILIANCNAHCRRNFFRAMDGQYRTEAEKGLRYYQVLYRIERSIKKRQERAKKRGAAEPDVLALRQRFSVPVLRAFKEWLIVCEGNKAILPKSSFKKAVRYALKRWDTLTRFTSDPMIPIDNNAIERIIRLFAVGRKNFLFASSEVGAKSVAVVFSLLQTCRMHGVDPELYLADVLVRIHRTPKEELHTLLPHNWAHLYAAQAQGELKVIVQQVQEAERTEGTAEE